MKATLRITALECADTVVELAFFEIWSMQTYLTGVWNMSFTDAAAVLNIWEGSTKVFPIFFLFLVDGFMGNFQMVVLSSIAYCVGLALLFTSSSLVQAGCRHYNTMCIDNAEKVLFYTALPLIAVGVCGHRVSLFSFRQEQREQLNDQDYSPGYRELVFPFLVSTIGGIGLPYIKQWRIRFGIPAVCVVVATLMFLTGICTYRKSAPSGSPIMNVCRVFVASASNISKPYPFDSATLYMESKHSRRTRDFRFLDKAAIITPDMRLEERENINRWRLCTVEEVEETKCFVRVAPVWMTLIVCGIVSSFANTYFQEQANHMNNRVGKLEVPPVVFLMVLKWIETICEAVYVATFKLSWRGKMISGILVAMVSSVLCCITAAKIETRRLGVIKRYGLVNKPDEDIPMTIFWLLTLTWLVAIMNSLLKQVAYDFSKFERIWLSDSLKYFAEGMYGIGYMCGPILVKIVGKISEKGGKTNWFQHTLNGSRLDKYYWVMAVLCSLNLLLCIWVVLTYRYRSVTDQELNDLNPEATVEG